MNNGTLYYNVGNTEKTYKIPTTMKVSNTVTKRVTAPIDAKNVTITNNFNKADIITFKNLKKNATYTIYKDHNKKTKIDQFKASNTTVSRSIKQLTPNAGAIYITVTEDDFDESNVTKVTYKAEKIPSFNSKNVTVTNNYNANDKIVLKGLTKGFTYTIYSDSSLKKKLASFTATSSSKTVTIKQLGTKAGSLYIVVSKAGYLSSTATKVNYKTEKLSSLSAKNVAIQNNTKSDKITLKGLKKGFTYTIYSDSKLKKRLASFKATSSKRTVTVKQVGAKAGSVYVVVSKSGYVNSSATKVNFKGEKLSSISAKNVSIKNNVKSDKISFKGLKTGYTYTVYLDKNLKRKLITFKATSSKRTVTVKQVGVKAGSVYVVVSKSGYTSSKATKVNFKKQSRK